MRDAGAIGAEVEPVAQAVGDDVVVGFCGKVIDVAFHHVVRFGQDAAVAVPLVHAPGNQDAGAAPFGGIDESVVHFEVFRRNIGNQAVGMLGIAHVAGDFIEQRAHVVVKEQ